MNIFLLNYSIKEVFLDSISNKNIIEIDGLGYCYVTSESIKNTNPHIDERQTKIIPKFFPYYTPSLDVPNIKSLSETNNIEIRTFIAPGLRNFLNIYDSIFLADSKNKIIGIVRKNILNQSDISNEDNSTEAIYYYDLSFSQGFMDLINNNGTAYIKEISGKEIGQSKKVLLELNTI